AEALRLWRVPVSGDPLGDPPVPSTSWAGAELAGLVQARLAAVEDHWECVLRLAAGAYAAAGGPSADRAVVAAGALALRQAGTAVVELEAALLRFPLRTRLWELLLVAAFLSAGRGAAADVERRARHTFVAQLEVEPGQWLGGLAEAARRGDLVDRWARRAAPGSTAAPVRTVRAARTRPPVPLTPLLGREHLLQVVGDRLTAPGLVTLTGPGGAGKTRLAVAVAEQQPSGACFVDLSAVEEPARVPDAVAAAVAVRDEPGRELAAALAAALAAEPTLLLLDNCEHLVPAVADLVGRLLARCPGLRVLATSRTALRVAGEVVVPVPPLATPLPGTGHTIAGLAAHPASRLFLDRALARSGRPVPESSADAVARLCAELEGLPLAIELAAARTPLLGVAQIVDRIRVDPQVLASSSTVLPSRHRTLAAAVGSSVEQLDPAARTLFDRLSVWAGGFDADAARAVGGPSAVAALARLVDASLVEAIPAEGPPRPDDARPVPARYRMLVPIRRYALTRLAASGEEARARRAHAAHVVALAERADQRIRGTDQECWLRRLRVEGPNLRAAMRWLSSPAGAVEPHGDLRLAAGLAMYCRLEGRYREGHDWLAAALSRHPDAPAALRARAGIGAAMLAMLLCDYPTAAGHAEAAQEACRAAGDRRGAARVQLILGSVAREQARYADSSAHLATAAALFAEYGDEWGEAQAAQLRGFTAWLHGDLDRAESRLRWSLHRYERLGDPEAEATALMNLGAVALYRGDVERAASLLDAALQRYAALGFPEGVGWAHNLRGLVELRTGRTDRAVVHLAVSLTAHRQVGDRWRTASVLEALAEVARLDGDPVRAARLLGAAAGIRAEIGAPVPDCERAAVDGTVRQVRTALGAERFDAAHGYGRHAALDGLLGPSSAVPAPLAPG
ncbi:MAG TPA: AAA family ATPase, partial [Micromonospora sp.]